jgi:hypothetical protein
MNKIISIIFAILLFNGCRGDDGKPLKKETPSKEPKEINGYKLPPEPDPKINNSTLLGIDSNNNGIRDDVERKIIKKYRDPIKIEVQFQDARVAQKILASPLKDAKILERESAKQTSCMFYLKHQKVISGDDIGTYLRFIENSVFNTKERLKKYLDFNRALSGGVYGTHELGDTAKACEFDVDSMLKKRKQK